MDKRKTAMFNISNAHKNFSVIIYQIWKLRQFSTMICA